MIRLSYSSASLAQLSLPNAIDAVAMQGYDGIELNLHRTQFNPFNVSGDELGHIHKCLKENVLTPACIATATHFFTPSQPHEPSLLTLDLAGRKQRISLVKRGIKLARQLGVRQVTFGSGFVRAEHVSHPDEDLWALLVEGITECLKEIGMQEDITLLIEPEPGMFIETVEQAIALIDAVGSPKFRLHVDICHLFCTERDPLAALADAAPLTRYLHVSDAEEGHNLGFVAYEEEMLIDPHGSTLVYFPDTGDFLLASRVKSLLFCDNWPNSSSWDRITTLLNASKIYAEPAIIHYDSLPVAASPLDDEIFTYLISVSRLSFDVLFRAWPILSWLRGVNGRQHIKQRLANTRTGIVHYHDIPGRGCLDLAVSLDVLDRAGFDGYATVELYHHVDCWQMALKESHEHLTKLLEKQYSRQVI